MSSRKHADMVKSLKDAPKAVILDRIKTHSRNHVAQYIEENRFDAGASGSASRFGGSYRSIVGSRPETVASNDSFDTAGDSIAVAEPIAGIASPGEEVATLAPNALCLTPVQLVCIHRQFDRLEFDFRRYGRESEKLRPVVELQDGDEKYYFVKMPDGTILQVTPTSPRGEGEFRTTRSLRIS